MAASRAGRCVLRAAEHAHSAAPVVLDASVSYSLTLVAKLALVAAVLQLSRVAVALGHGFQSTATRYAARTCLLVESAVLVF